MIFCRKLTYVNWGIGAYFNWTSIIKLYNRFKILISSHRAMNLSGMKWIHCSLHIYNKICLQSQARPFQAFERSEHSTVKACVLSHWFNLYCRFIAIKHGILPLWCSNFTVNWQPLGFRAPGYPIQNHIWNYSFPQIKWTH